MSFHCSKFYEQIITSIEFLNSAYHYIILFSSVARHEGPWPGVGPDSHPVHHPGQASIRGVLSACKYYIYTRVQKKHTKTFFLNAWVQVFRHMP